MKSFRFIVAFLLLVVAVTSSTTAGALIVNHTAPPAGCHEHGKKIPPPQHADYACCVAGHSAAVVQASDVQRAPLQVSFSTIPTVVLQAVPSYNNETVSTASSASPPILISLRI